MNPQGVEIIPGDLTVKIDGDVFKTIEINDDLIESIVQSIIDFKEWREYVGSKKKIKMENNIIFSAISMKISDDILEDCHDETQICKFVPNFRLLCTSPPIIKEHTNSIAGNFGPVIHRSASFSRNFSNFQLKHKFVNGFLKFRLFTQKLNVSLKLSNVNVMSALFKKKFCPDISHIGSARKFYFDNAALRRSVTTLLCKANIRVDILGGLNSTSAILTVKKAVQTHENKSEEKADNKNSPVNRHGDDLSSSNRDLIITMENNCDINKNNLFHVVAKDGRDAKEIDISTNKRNNSTISIDCKLKSNSHISESTKAKNSEDKVAPANEVKRSDIKEENGKYAKEIYVSTIKKNYFTIPTDYQIKNNSHLSESAKTKNSEHKVAPANEVKRSEIKVENGKYAKEIGVSTIKKNYFTIPTDYQTKNYSHLSESAKTKNTEHKVAPANEVKRSEIKEENGKYARKVYVSTIKKNDFTIPTDYQIKNYSHLSESAKTKNTEHKVAPANEVKRSEIKEENGKYARKVYVSTIKKNYFTTPTDYQIKNNSHLSESAKTKNSEHKVAPASEAERSKVKEKNETLTEKSVGKIRPALDIDTHRTGEVQKLKTGESDRRTADATETTSTYKVGFEERRDNNVPKWQSQKFNSFSDALDFMKNQWQVRHMSNPHVDITRLFIIKNNSNLSVSAKIKNSEHKVAPASEAERSKVKEKNETFTETSVGKKRSAPDFDTHRTGEVKKFKTGESDRRTADTTETTSTYKLGFEERRDNNDPKWQSQKFNSISDALDFMKNQWQVRQMSNPHVDMTTRFINSGKITNKNQRKPLPQLTVSCAGLFDRQIDRVNNAIYNIDKKIDALPDECYNYYSYDSSYYKVNVNNLTQQYTKEKEQLENQYASLCDARNEVDQFYKFYNARYISQYQKNENDCQRKAILSSY